MSDILNLVSIRDRLKQLFMEPTLDKAFTTFATILLGTFFITLFAPFLGRPVQYELLLIQAAAIVASTFLGLVFKHFDQSARDAASERLKKEIELTYLLKNPKLKATEITLDTLEGIRDEMSIIRQIICLAFKDHIDAETLKKGVDPNYKGDSTHVYPWETVDGSYVPPQEAPEPEQKSDD